MKTDTQTITITRNSKKERLAGIRDLLTRGYVPIKTYEYQREEVSTPSTWYMNSVSESKRSPVDFPTAYVAVLRRKIPCTS